MIALAIAGALIVRHYYNDDLFGFAVFVTGVVGVYLVAVEHIWNWPVGLLNVSIWGWICYSGRLFADMSLQMFFFALGVHGWYFWIKGGDKQTPLRISKVSPRGWLLMGLALVVGVSIYVPITMHFKADWIWVDSILTVIAIIAQVLVNLKKIESWILWMIVNAAYIPVYKAKGYYSLVYLSAILFLLAVGGFIKWNKLNRADSALNLA